MPSTIMRPTLEQAEAQQYDDLVGFLSVAARVAGWARAKRRVPDELRHELHAAYMSFHCSSLALEDLETRLHSEEVPLAD